MDGLKMFFPNPPKSILPKATPKMIPTMAIQKGRLGGRERENIILVTKMAEVTDLLFLKLNTASVNIPKIRDVITRKKDRQPKR